MRNVNNLRSGSHFSPINMIVAPENNNYSSRFVRSISKPLPLLKCNIRLVNQEAFASGRGPCDHIRSSSKRILRLNSFIQNRRFGTSHSKCSIRIYQDKSLRNGSAFERYPSGSYNMRTRSFGTARDNYHPQIQYKGKGKNNDFYLRGRLEIEIYLRSCERFTRAPLRTFLENLLDQLRSPH